MKRQEIPKNADAIYKTIIIGDGNAGKTCILKRFVDNQFLGTRVQTIGVDYHFKSLQVRGVEVKLQIWDTAGQEYFQSLTKQYWHGSHAIIIVYDVTNMESFERLNYWLKETKSVLSYWEDIVIAVVGNKADLVEERVVDKSMAKEFADHHGLLYYETSALTGENINTMFYDVASDTLQLNQYPSIRRPQPSSDSFRPSPNPIRGVNETWFGYFKNSCNIL